MSFATLEWKTAIDYFFRQVEINNQKIWDFVEEYKDDEAEEVDTDDAFEKQACKLGVRKVGLIHFCESRDKEPARKLCI